MSAVPSATQQQAPEAVTPAGTAGTPLGFVVDGESTLRHFVSLILQGSGIDTMEFVDGATLRKASLKPQADIVFLDVNLDVQDATETIEWLGQAGFAGVVQLMSNRGSAVLESVRSTGERHKVKNAIN